MQYSPRSVGRASARPRPVNLTCHSLVPANWRNSIKAKVELGPTEFGLRRPLPQSSRYPSPVAPPRSAIRFVLFSFSSS